MWINNRKIRRASEINNKHTLPFTEITSYNFPWRLKNYGRVEEWPRQKGCNQLITILKPLLEEVIRGTLHPKFQFNYECTVVD